MGRKDLVDDARRVAKRGERTGVEELRRLIHAVNPTGEGLSKSDTDDRYKLKSALQTLLIAWHGDAIRVRTTADPEIVALDHVGGQVDAAHSRVAELGDEAQLWVRRRLVAQELADDRPERPAWSAPKPKGLVERATHELEKVFDFDAGETLLTAALETDEAPAAALALVEHLVRYARDEEALAVSIPESVRYSGRIRLALASASLALARPHDALQHLDGLAGLEAAEAVRKSAGQLVDASDVNAAHRALISATDLEPKHPDLAALTTRLQALRSSGWQPLVVDYERALASRDLDAAGGVIDEVQARAGVVAWVLEARSEVARRRERLRASALVATADTVPPERAVVLLREARALGIDGLDDRITAIETGLEQLKDAREVRRIVGLLAEGDAMAGLVAWAYLPDALRAEVRARCDHPWLDAVEAGLTVAPAQEVVRALARLDALDGVEVEGVLGALTGIAGLPEVERRRSGARASIAATEEIADRARLRRASDALDRGDPTTCRRLLAEVSGRGDTKDGLKMLRERLAAHDVVEAREKRWLDLAADPMPFDARRYASELAERPDAEPHWAARSKAADDRLTALFQVRRLEPEDLEARAEPPRLGAMEPWTRCPAEPLVVVECLHWSVFIAEVDPNSGRRLGGWHVHVPVPLTAAKHGVDGDTVWIVTEEKAFLLVVNLLTGRVESWIDVYATLGTGTTQAFVHDGILWAHVGANYGVVVDQHESVRLIDIRKRTRLPVDAPVSLAALLPGDPPRLAGLRKPRAQGMAALWLDTRGAVVSTASSFVGQPHSPIPDPLDPEGMIVPVRDLDSKEQVDPRKNEHEVALIRCRDGTSRQARMRLLVRRWNAMSSGEAGLVVVSYAPLHKTRRLAAYRPDAPDDRPVWVVEAPEGHLVTSLDGEAVWYSCRDPESAQREFHRIGSVAPRFTHRSEWKPPTPQMLHAMTSPLLSLHSIPDKPAPEGGWDDPVVPPEPDWSDVRLVAWWIGRQLPARGGRGGEMLDKARIRWPKDGWLAHIDLQRCLKLWRWRDAVASLPIEDLAGLSTDHRDHARHYAGAARLFTGDREGAEVAWQGVSDPAIRANIDADRALADALQPFAAPTATGLRLAAHIAEACRRSDAALREGDPAGAFAALDDAEVWQVCEVQSIARRAEAALAWTDGPWAQRRRAVDAFKWILLNKGDVTIPHLPIADALDVDGMTELVERATAWVDPMDMRVFVRGRNIINPPTTPIVRPPPLDVPALTSTMEAVPDPVPGLLSAGASIADLVAAGATAAELRPLRDAINRQRPPIVDRVPRGRRLIADEPTAPEPPPSPIVEPVVAPPPPRPILPFPNLSALVPPAAGEPVERPLPARVVVRLLPPSASAPFALRLDVIRHGSEGELPPIACPTTVAELRRTATVSSSGEAMVRAAAQLAKLLGIGVHTASPGMFGELVFGLLPLLAKVEVTVDDLEVTVDPTPLRPRVDAVSDGDALQLKWNPRIMRRWPVGPGIVQTVNGIVRPLVEELSPDLLEALAAPLPDVPAEHVERFIQELVVDQGADVELPDGLVRAVAPSDRERRLLLSEEAGELCVRWAVAYRVDDDEIEVRSGTPGRYARGRHATIVRDDAFEREAARDFAQALGIPLSVRLPRDGALAFLADELQDLRATWVVRGEERLLAHRVRARLTAHVEVSTDRDWFDLRVDFRAGDLVVTAAEALALWREGRRYKTLDDASLLLLPVRWLHRHAATLGAIAEAREDGRPGAWVAAVARDLLADAGLEHHAENLRTTLVDPPAKSLPDGFGATLRPYQQRGYEWLCALRDSGVGGILADDMGLGKTVQTIALLASTHAIDGAPSLVVAPTSVVANWRDELARFAPALRVATYHGADRVADFTGSDVVLTSYGTLRRDEDLEVLAAVEWRHVVLDEAQAIKNASSRTARAAHRLNGRHRLALSGTPIENGLGDLWSLFQFLMPGFFGRQGSFVNRYGAAFRNRDADTLAALRARVRPFVMRRLKSEVATDLPARTSVVLRVAMSPEDSAWYLKIRDSVRQIVAEKVGELGFERARVHVLSALVQLRRACCHPGLLPFDEAKLARTSSKCQAVLDVLTTARAAGHRCLVFSEWPTLLRLLREETDVRGFSSLYMDGDTVDRASLVRSWNSADGADVFLLGLRVGGVGLNLTGADHVLLVEPAWNPAIEAQAVDRVHRIGQDKPVMVYRFITAGTVEEKVRDLQAAKRQLAGAVIDGTDEAAALTPDVLRDILDATPDGESEVKEA